MSSVKTVADWIQVKLAEKKMSSQSGVNPFLKQVHRVAESLVSGRVLNLVRRASGIPKISSVRYGGVGAKTTQPQFAGSVYEVVFVVPVHWTMLEPFRAL